MSLSIPMSLPAPAWRLSWLGVVVVLALPGCGVVDSAGEGVNKPPVVSVPPPTSPGGDGDNGGGGPSTPVADVVAREQDKVVLSASVQDDFNDIASFQWRQIPAATGLDGDAALVPEEGTGIELQDADKPEAFFIAPAVEGPTTYRFRLTVTDNFGESGQADVTVLVNSIAVADSTTVLEDSRDNTLDVLINDTRAVAGEAMEITNVGGPNRGGTVVISGVGSGNTLSYTPLPDFVGTETFSYTVKDAEQKVDTARVSVTITNTNDPPVLANPGSQGSASGQPISPVIMQVTELDPGDTLSFSARNLPAGLSIDAGTGVISGTPRVAGVFTVGVTVRDAAGASDTVTFQWQVANSPPTVVDDFNAVTEDDPVNTVTGDVRANDFDGEDALADLVVTEFGGSTKPGRIKGIYGDLDWQASGKYSYVLQNRRAETNALAAGQQATDVFGYLLTDTDGGSGNAVLTVTVTGANDAPVARADRFTVSEDSLDNVLDVLANDLDPDQGDPLSLVSVGTPGKGGRVSLGISGPRQVLKYTPAADFFGKETFTYTMKDAGGLNSSTTVTMTVSNVNDLPVAEDASFRTSEDVPLNERLSGSDPDGDPLNFRIIEQGTKGRVTITRASTGAFRYVPGPNVSGVDTFTFKVSDGRADSNIGTVTVTIQPVNDAPVVAPGQGFQVAENSPGGTVVGVVKATDVDGAVTGFSIVAGNTANAFAINAGGRLTVASRSALDFERSPTFTLKITATDGVATSVAQTVTVALTNVNDSVPVVAPGQRFSVAENSPRGTVAGRVQATDADGGNTIAGFAIAGGNTGNAFAISANGTLSVANGAALDFEVRPTVSLLVTATDGLNTSAPATVTINVTDANDNPPVVTAGQRFEVRENSSNGKVVGTVRATDGDGDNTITGFRIAGGNTGGAFAITDKGVLTVANGGALDFETQPVFRLSVTASDGVHTSAAETVTVNLSDDPNEAAPVVTPGQGFSIVENSPVGTAVGTVQATDADGDNTITGFRIAGGNTGGAFSITDAGVIRVASSGALDFETRPVFALSVTASDGVHTSVAETVTVRLADAPNEAVPVVTPGQRFALDENSPKGVVAGTVQATDADGNGTIAGFSITGGNAGGAFSIDAGGRLTVDKDSALDFETTPTFSLKVTATDGANTSAPQTVTVDLRNLNDNAPSVTGGQAFSVDENSPDGTGVGRVVATDADGSGTITGFSITGGNTGGAFAIDSSGRLTVQTGSALDYEGSPSFGLRVTATDGANTSREETVTVDLRNLNDNTPSVPAGQEFSVDENSPDGTPVGRVAATDADGNDTITGFGIIAGNTGGAFAIDNGGQLTVAGTAMLDFEAIPSFDLTVTATDGPHTSPPVTVTVRLNDLPEISLLTAQGTSQCWTTAQEEVLRGSLADGGTTAGTTYTLVSAARKGEITITDPESGAFEYTPHARGPRGADTFVYRVKDPENGARERTATVVVAQKLLALGDEITEGLSDGKARSPRIARRVGYRKALYEMLRKAGYEVDLVGTLRAGGAYGGFDADHEGHSGWSAYELAWGELPTGEGGVFAWLQAHPADVILLHAGTHGLSSSAADVQAILDQVDRWEASPGGNPVTVLVASIIDQAPSDPDIALFNESLAAMVMRRSGDPLDPAYPDRVVLVDQHGALDYPRDLSDGVHPTPAGYDKMSMVWYRALTSAKARLLDRCP